MPTLRHLLVAVDLSPASVKALTTAVDLAIQLDAELTVLHVVPIAAASALAATPEDAGADQDAHLDAFVAEHVGGVLAAHRGLAQGDPAVEIVRAAHDIGADMIVVGTHGRGGLSHLLLGSVAERVLRDAPVPVVVVRQDRGTPR